MLQAVALSGHRPLSAPMLICADAADLSAPLNPVLGQVFIHELADSASFFFFSLQART